jgi:hypothetical protein
MTARAAAELEHAIIEAAKVSYRDDQDLPFVRHLEIHAGQLAPTDWTWETRHTGSGGWVIELWPVARVIEPDQPRGLL